MPVVSARQDYPVCPAGLYLGIAVDVLDLGVVTSDLYGDKPMLRIYWQIAGEVDEHGKPFEVSRRFTKTLHKRSALRQTLEGWRSRPFTEEELKGWEVDAVIGASAQIQVVNVQKDGVTYANVQSVLPLMKGVPPVPWPAGYVRRQDRPDYKPPSQSASAPTSEASAFEDESVPF